MSHLQHHNKAAARYEDLVARREVGEERLGAKCAECRDLHARYVEGCFSLEHIESTSDMETELGKARDRVSASRRAWLSAAGQAMRTPARTRTGVKAKFPVVKGLLQEAYADNTEAVSIALTFIDEIERLLSDNP